MEVDYRPVAEFPGYRVGNDGSIWSCVILGGPTPRIGDVWHQLNPGGKRYILATLTDGSGKVFRYGLHVLILEAFVGPRPDGMECRHKNGNSKDNRLSNLAWATHQENMDDRKLHGTVPTGEKNAAAKLDEAKVEEIRTLLASGMSQRKIAAKFGVSKYPIWAIANNKNWKVAA